MKVRSKRIHNLTALIAALLSLILVCTAVPASRSAFADWLDVSARQPDTVAQATAQATAQETDQTEPNAKVPLSDGIGEEPLQDAAEEESLPEATEEESSPEASEEDLLSGEDLQTNGDTSQPAIQAEENYASVAYVSTEKELSSAVTNSTTDYIVLTSNITTSSNIAIPTSKTQLTIDGQNLYTLTQDDRKTFTSSSTSSAVYTIRNMTVVGTKDEGIISVSSSRGAPTLVFENISYTGPQFILNRYGRAEFYGTNTVIIQENSGANNVEEVGEVHGVTVYGKLNVATSTRNDSFFWMFADGTERPYLKVEDGGYARFTTTAKMSSRGFFYVDGTTYNVDLSVQDNAHLVIDISGYNPLSTSESHRVESIYIGKNAYASFNFAGGIALNGTITVNEGATLLMHYRNEPGTSESAYAYPLFRFLRATSVAPLMILNKPKLVVFAVEPANRPLFGLAYANPLFMNTTDFNYWTSYAAAEAKQKPAGMWSSDTKNSFNIQLNLQAGQDMLNTLISNVPSFNAGFNPKNARVIQVGTDPYPLVPNEQSLESNVTTGDAMPTSNVFIEYRDTENKQHSYSGTADFMGKYTVNIDNTSLSADTAITATAVFNFVAVRAPVPLASTAEWINVRIPVKMLFGTMEEYGDGAIISPQYEIENESSMPIQIDLSGFSVIDGDTINLLSGPDAQHKGQDLKLDLQVAGGSTIEYLSPEMTSDSATTLETLAPSTKVRMSLGGEYFGSYEANTVYKPSYSLVWTFTPKK